VGGKVGRLFDSINSNSSRLTALLIENLERRFILLKQKETQLFHNQLQQAVFENPSACFRLSEKWH
jgi:hypothetical protein